MTEKKKTKTVNIKDKDGKTIAKIVYDHDGNIISKKGDFPLTFLFSVIIL